MPAGQAAAASVDASAAPAAAAGRRKKKGKKKVVTSNSELMNVDGDFAAVVGTSAAPLFPALTSLKLSPSAPDLPGAPAQRKLEKKVSRERSPRLGPSSATHSSLPSSSPTASTCALGPDAGSFSVGQAALLVDLVSRPELSGSSVTLLSFDASSLRWAASLSASGETIRVKASNLRPQ